MKNQISEGDVGPCGPCSEIFYDHGWEAENGHAINFETESGRFVEIWNNVFMQFNESESGRSPLPKPSVDTGAGLERFSAVMQRTNNNYNTDLFEPIIKKTCQIAGIDLDELLAIEKMARNSKDSSLKEKLKPLAAIRVIADHSRAATFLIAEGAFPSNKGSGYVLRRIMRRAIRYGRTISKDKTLYAQTVGVVLDEMGNIYPELLHEKESIIRNVNDETNRFISTLDQGTEILNEKFKKMNSRGDTTVDGETVFKLYDTFGFPVDLTRLMAEENGFKVDETEFLKRMEAARKKSKEGKKNK